jgi:group II intron maturase
MDGVENLFRLQFQPALPTKFLGFSFTANREQNADRGESGAWFIEKVRELKRRTRGVKVERMAAELDGYLRGDGYFGQCQTPSVLRGLEQWTRLGWVCDLEAVEARIGTIR